MAIRLSKGQKVSLSKEAPNLNCALVGCGWDANQFVGDAIDLDIFTFVLDGSGRVQGGDKSFVFFGNQYNTSNSVGLITGDNQTGSGDGDDEIVQVNINELPSEVEKIVFAVVIYDAINRRQNFGMISNSYIRIVNAETNEEILRFDLGEDFSTETAVIFGELYKRNGEWKFSAVGQGYSEGLVKLCADYGVEAEL